VAVARVLGPEQVGYYNFVLWLVTMIALLGMAGLPAATSRYVADPLHRGCLEEAWGIFRYLARLQLISATVITAAGIPLAALLSPPGHRDYTVLAMLAILPSMLTSVATNGNFAADAVRWNIIPSVISMAFNFVGVVISLWLGWNLVGLVAVLLVTRIIDCGIRFWGVRQVYLARGILNPRIFLPRKGLQPPLEIRRRALKFAGETLTMQLVETFLWNRAQLLFLRAYSPIQEIAFFTLGFNLAERMLMLPQSFAHAVGLSMLFKAGQGTAAVGPMAGGAIRYLWLMAIPMFLGLGLLSAPFVQVVYGDRFAPAALPMTIICVSNIMRLTVVPLRSLAMAADNQRFIVWWSMVAAGVNLGVSYLLIPRYHAVGAAFSVVAAQAVALAGIWIFSRKRIGLQVSRAALIRLVGAGALMGVVVWAMTLVLPGWMVLILAPPAGAAVYLVGMWQLGALQELDYQRFGKLTQKLPARWRPAADLLLRTVCRTPAQAM